LRSKLGALPYRAYLRALGAWTLPHYAFPRPTDQSWCSDSLAHYKRTAGSWKGVALGGVPEEALASRD
jgi:hypothetical protein